MPEIIGLGVGNSTDTAPWRLVDFGLPDLVSQLCPRKCVLLFQAFIPVIYSRHHCRIPQAQRGEMETKHFKDLCGHFANDLDQLRNSYEDKVLSQDKFKEICKSIAQQVAFAMLC